jgi:DNA recombination protein RmuC
MVGWFVLGVLVGAVVGGVLAGSFASSRAGARVRAAEVAAARLQARWEADRDAWRARAEDAEQTRDLDRDRQAEQFRVLAADTLLEPLGRALEQVRHEVATAERARAEGAAALREQVGAMRDSSHALREETARLVTALRSSHVRGRWGEMQLRRVVEAAGMVPYVDFVEQESVRTDDGLLRPDLIVRMAGGRNLVVDAKVAFLGFLEAVEASDDEVRARRMAAHARHVREHVDALASKRYWELVTPSPELVVMFVPAESFWQAAVEQDPGLVEYAFERDVVVATPSTLLALLRTVAYAWRQDRLAGNAQAVLDLGKELHGRLATLGGHVARLGRALDGASAAYNQAVASLETRVLVSARRFAAMGVVDGELVTPAATSVRAAALGAPELVAAAGDRVVVLDGLEAG